MILQGSWIRITDRYSLEGDVITSSSLHGDDCFANRFRVRHMNQDTAFDEATLTEDGRTIYLVYRHLLEDLRILRNVITDAG